MCKMQFRLMGFQWKCAHVMKMADYRNRSSGNGPIPSASDRTWQPLNMTTAFETGLLLGFLVAIPSLLFLISLEVFSHRPSPTGSCSSGLCSPLPVDGAQSISPSQKLTPAVEIRAKLELSGIHV